MEKILSIIIPSYNMEKYLDRCLSSLIVNDDKMAQLEVLILNDGSKDKTSEIGHKYEFRFPGTFRVIDKENGHYGSCVNRGLDEAQGTFVKILDADDSLDTAVFSAFLSFLTTDEASQADMILSDYAYVDNQVNLDKEIHYSSHDDLFPLDHLTQYDEYVWFIHGITYRTSILKENHYKQTEGIPYTDLEWSILPLVHIKNILKFDGVLYLYTIGREGQSVSPDEHKKNLHRELQIKRNIIQYLPISIVEGDDSSNAFIRDRVRIIVNYLYQDYIFSFPGFSLCDDNLLSFDRFLKYYPGLYSSSNDYSTKLSGGLVFYPIRDWRNKRRFSLIVQKMLYSFSSISAQIRKHK